MEVVTKKNLILVAGRGHPELSSEVAQHLHVPLGEVMLSTFANGEIYCRYGENIRGADVFVFQSHADAINDRLMEQLIMIDAAKRASAKRITAVSPFYGYSRQDRKAEGREPITARLVADMLTCAGADRVVTVDLHTGQIQGFFDFPVDHLTAVPVLVDYLASSLPSGVANLRCSSLAAISLNSFSRRSRIGFGVPFGTCTDHHAIRSELVMPTSAALGISGSALKRSLDVVASARILPAFN